jgi:3-oxoacyl-[acyl-carrier-protein] synthase-3
MAAEKALAAAGCQGSDIDAVIFATMTPDHFFPGNGPLLQQRLGLGSIPTFDIRQQCSGFLYGLDLGDSLIRSGKYKRVLLVGAEVHTPFMPWDHGYEAMIDDSYGPVSEEDRAFNTKFRDRTVLFGDAGAAVVLEATDDESKGVQTTRLFTDGSLWEALCVKGVSFTERPYVTREQIDNHSWIPSMEGREVFRQAISKMPEAVRQVCADAGVEVGALDMLLIHQANLRIVEGVQKALGLPAEKVPHNIERYGNTTAATLPLLFHEQLAAGKITPGMLICFTALGSGLHWGATLYRT